MSREISQEIWKYNALDLHKYFQLFFEDVVEVIVNLLALSHCGDIFSNFKYGKNYIKVISI